MLPYILILHKDSQLTRGYFRCCFIVSLDFLSRIRLETSGITNIIFTSKVRILIFRNILN
jgi:hypothetical protein